MKKNILFLAVSCLVTTASFANGPDGPILSTKVTSSQQMMMPSVNESIQLTIESQQQTLSVNMLPGCLKYGVESAHAEQAFYGTSGDSQELVCLANFYYQLCNDAGGPDHVLAPIFL